LIRPRAVKLHIRKSVAAKIDLHLEHGARAAEPDDGFQIAFRFR